MKLKVGEWESVIRYLTAQPLPDLVSAQATAKLATESSVLGPCHHEETVNFENRQSIASKRSIGEPMLIHSIVRDIDGFAIKGAMVDIWETNGNSLYDMQDPNCDRLDCRGI